MTDKKHTKEPWRISDDPDYPEAVILTDETIIADANIFGANSSKKKNMANAKRIVECVNACAGIENPLDLRRQRDELREALETLLNACKALPATDGRVVGLIHLFSKCENALTKTKESM